MADNIPDTCARCGDSLSGRPRYFDLKHEWRDYLKDERDLGWFPMGPVVVCCPDCNHRFDHLKDALSEYRAYGSDEQVNEVEEMATDELDGLDLDGIVDHGHFM